MRLSHEIATRRRLNFASGTVREVAVPSVEESSAALFLAPFLTPTEQTTCMKLDDLNSHRHEHGVVEASSKEATHGSLHGGVSRENGRAQAPR